MGLFDIFKKKPEVKCSTCLRPIKENIWNLDGKTYCLECYHQKMAIVQQSGGYTPAAPVQTASAPAKETFVCNICKRERPIKYRYKANTCTECAESGRKAVSFQSCADSICIGSQHISGPNMHILCQVAYSPSARMVVCTTTTTGNTIPSYETLAVPEEIRTADALIAFIQSQRGPWLVYGYTLGDDLRNHLDTVFTNTDNENRSNISAP